MPIEKVDCTLEILDNFLEIKPIAPLKNDSIYEIKVKGLTSLNGNVPLDVIKVKFVTEMTPMFCSIMGVESLLDIIHIPEDIILYNIREASKYAEYIFDLIHKGKKKIDKDNVPFAVREFTRFKAARDCVMKIYMSLATSKTVEGTLGEVKFKNKEQIPDLKKILEYLDKEINKWLDAIKGHELEGRSEIKTAVRGYHHGGLNSRTSSDRKVTPKPVPLDLGRGTY